jgi:hypothetical protein
LKLFYHFLYIKWISIWSPKLIQNWTYVPLIKFEKLHKKYF